MKVFKMFELDFDTFFYIFGILSFFIRKAIALDNLLKEFYIILSWKESWNILKAETISLWHEIIPFTARRNSHKFYDLVP